MSTAQGKTHPIFIIAAVAVIVFSAVGVGVMTGLIPSSFSKNESAQVTGQETAKPTAAETTSAKPMAKVAEAPKATPHVTPRPKTHVALNDTPAEKQPAAKEAAKVCANCGVVESVNVVAKEGEGTGLGVVAGGVAGALLGNQIGQGRGNTAATILGAAGGAYAGHEIEKKMKETKRYDIRVRMDDGSLKTVSQQTEPTVKAGDKVRIVDGNVVPQ